MSEKPEHQRPRRLADWLNPTGARKAHSLIDKVYKRKNLQMAWEKVKANQGAGGVDGESIEAFGERLDERLEQLHEELRTDCFRPQPVRRRPIPKMGKPGEYRMLGIPTIFDRVCQQALLNRLEPIFEPVFDEASFGYRRGRSTKDALRKVWKEIEAGGEWIVDADLKDFFRNGGPRKAAGTGLATGVGRTSTAPDWGDAQSRQLWRGSTASDGARYPAGLGDLTPAQQYSPDAF